MCRTQLAHVEKRPCSSGSLPGDNVQEMKQLRKIFKELVKRSEESTLGLDLMEFLKFTELPGLLGEQFFRTLDDDCDGRLSSNEFARGFLRLYKGSRTEIAEMLFALLDFARKGYVTVRDMRCLLLYLPRACLRCGTRSALTWNIEEKAGFCFTEREVLRLEDLVSMLEAQQELFNAVLEALITTLPPVLDVAVGCIRQSLCGGSQCRDVSQSREVLAPLRHKGRTYFFALRNAALYYYNSVEQTVPKGIIPLQGVLVSPEGDTQFALKGLRSSCEFEAVSREQRDDWVERILQETSYRWFDDVYELKEVLGSGAHGQVVRAVSKISGIAVAVKIINKKDMDTSAEFRLRREISILQHVSHPNVLECYDVFETLERIYIVTEMLEGGSLFQYLEARHFCVTEDFVRGIVTDIANGLAFLHAHGIIHRDLKLENVMLRSDLRAVLIDFDLSCLLGPDECTSEAVGTLKYVAPEVLSRLKYRESADCWSLGVLMYAMLQGKMPFYGKTSQEIAMKILKRKLNFSRGIWPSEAAVSIVSGLLCRKADLRLPLSSLLESEWLKGGGTKKDESSRDSLDYLKEEIIA